jgi:adenylylsulfate kinase
LKILICGLPGSGKSTIAEPLAKLIGGVWINADAVRSKYEGPDVALWDFSLAGRVTQAQRMKHLADGVVLAGKIAITDFICPTEITRKAFGADFVVWMDTIQKGRYDDTNQMFEPPKHFDYHVSQWFNDTHAQLMPVVNRFLEVQAKKEADDENAR